MIALRRGKILLKIAFAFLLFNFSLVATAEKNYAIFIDAGSTGTRLHIFEYLSEQKLAISVPDLTDFYSTKTSPGLADFFDHLQDLPSYLKPLFDSAAKKLEAKKIPLDKVPIYLFATAGMRLLSEDQQQKIYAIVKEFIQKSYPFPIQKIETINGAMEGLYAWIDVNYLASNFKSDQNKKPHNSVGIIDMGSGSTQIVFATSGHKNSKDEFYVNINKKRYIVFSKNFLGLGQDTARMDMDLLADASACYPFNYPLNEEKKGDFNSTKCTIMYHSILNEHGLNRGQITTFGNSFIGINGFYYTYEFFANLNKQDHAKLETKMNRICHKNWEELQMQYPNDEYLPNYCANAVYFTELVYHTYQIRGSQLKILNKINGKLMNWTRGAALYNLFQ